MTHRSSASLACNSTIPRSLWSLLGADANAAVVDTFSLVSLLKSYLTGGVFQLHGQSLPSKHHHLDLPPCLYHHQLSPLPAVHQVPRT